MKSILSDAVSNYALASSSMPLWMVGPKPSRIGPHTRHEHRLHTATLTLVGTNIHSTAANLSAARGPSPQSPPRLRAARLFFAPDADASGPSAPPPTARELIDQVHLANMDEHHTVEWMVHLAKHDDDDVRRTAVTTLMARVLPRLLGRSLIGSSAEAVVLNELAEQELHADLKTKAAEALIHHAIPKWGAMLVGGNVSKLAALQRLSESTNGAVREAASRALNTYAHAMQAEAQEDDSWAVIPAPPVFEHSVDGYAWVSHDV